METLTIIDEKSMKHLSVPTQKLIKELSNELNIEKLQLFNPLVETMIVVEGFKDIKYEADNEESIQAYKDAKKVIGSFNATTKKTKSALKKPILEIGKKLDLIEKTFLGRAKDVMEYITTEFKPYIDEEERKKQERLDKKNKAQIDKIEELSEETVHQQLIMNRMNIKMKIDGELNALIPDALQKAQTFSKEALLNEIKKLHGSKSDGYNFNEEQLAILLSDQIEEIRSSFYRNIDSSVSILEMAMNKAETPLLRPDVPQMSQQDINNIETNESGIKMVAPSLSQENPDYFKNAISDILEECIDSLESLKPATPKESVIRKELVEYITQLQDKATDYLN